MMTIDLYAVLEVKKDATIEIIKKAYQRKAQLHHPDRNNGSSTEFVKIKQAYEVLSDSVKRMKYDETGFIDNIVESVDELQRARCIVFLSGLLNSIVNSENVDVDTTDIIGNLKDTLVTNKINNQLAIAKNNNIIKRRNKVIKRAKHKKGEANLLTSILDKANKSVREQTTALQGGIADFDFMLNMLDNYEYDFTNFELEESIAAIENKGLGNE